jgi:hypothetical protein
MPKRKLLNRTDWDVRFDFLVPTLKTEFVSSSGTDPFQHQFVATSKAR